VLKQETLDIIRNLMDMGFTDITISEDNAPVHKRDRPDQPEYILTIIETVFHDKLQKILKMLQEFPNVMAEASQEGFKIYEVEPKTETA